MCGRQVEQRWGWIWQLNTVSLSEDIRKVHNIFLVIFSFFRGGCLGREIFVQKEGDTDVNDISAANETQCTNSACCANLCRGIDLSLLTTTKQEPNPSGRLLKENMWQCCMKVLIHCGRLINPMFFSGTQHFDKSYRLHVLSACALIFQTKENKCWHTSQDWYEASWEQKEHRKGSYTLLS